MTRRQAFTVVELIVVIALIVLLIAMLMPALQMAREAARKAVCMSQQRQIGQAYFAYLNDNDGKSHNSPNHGRWWPNIGGGPGDPFIDANDPAAYWGVAYFEYANNLDVFHCPSTGLVDDWWENNQERYRYSTYGLNTYAKDRLVITVPNMTTRVLMQDAAEQLMDDFGDTLAITAGHPFNLYQWRITWGGSMPGRVREWFRHTGTGNVLWFDLHGSDVSETEVEGIPANWYTAP